MMEINTTNKKQQACSHPTIIFGSGDYYVMCRECSRTWVKVGLATDDADPSYVNYNVTGEQRHELTLDNVKVVINEKK